MIELRKTAEFLEWFEGLRDPIAFARIQMRLDRVQRGLNGDYKHVGEGVFELRIHCGPGYRVNFTHRGAALVIVLAGGDKGSQEQDIRKALELARTLDE